MKEIRILLPYAPCPVRTGAQAEMMAHLEALREVGHVTVCSARSRPVGAYWSEEGITMLRDLGISVVFREDQHGFSFRRWWGMCFGALFTALRLPQAFTVHNPYHRSAFPESWWRTCENTADLSVIMYSYWADLPCHSPKVVILSDLISGLTWSTLQNEVKCLASAHTVFCISQDEGDALISSGIKNVIWSPLCFSAPELPVSEKIALVGSSNRFNREGLAWLSRSKSVASLAVNVYGRLANLSACAGWQRMCSYDDTWTPHRDCGIFLMPTAGGTGVQIKAIEALCAGRAIVARRGAMRGLPASSTAWIEVDYPEQMIEEAQKLSSDRPYRERLGTAARSYAAQFLDAGKRHQERVALYARLIEKG